MAALVVLRVVALAAALASHPDAERSTIGGDAVRYEQIASASGVPYRDVAIEYPPGAWAVIEAVHGRDLFDTQVRLGVSQLVCDLLAAAVLAWGFGRRAGLAYLVLGAPFALYPFFYLRIDLVSVALAAAALALLHRRRDLTGEVGAGVLLAAAVLTKLWPFALLPLLLVQRRWRALGACAVAGGAAGLVWIGAAGIDGVLQVVSFRGARGWQLESVGGMVVHVLDPSRAHVEAGAWRTGVMPIGSRQVLTVLSFATIGAAWWWAHASTRSAHDGPTGDRPDAARTRVLYGLAPTACVLGLLVFAPIISPQYILWLLPWVAISWALAPTRWGVAATTVAVSALSTWSLASIKGQIDGNLSATVPILVRNVLLVALLAVTLAELARRAAPTAAHPADDHPFDERALQPAAAAEHDEEHRAQHQH